jgi:hypothetical protein
VVIPRNRRNSAIVAGKPERRKSTRDREGWRSCIFLPGQTSSPVCKYAIRRMQCDHKPINRRKQTRLLCDSGKHAAQEFAKISTANDPSAVLGFRFPVILAFLKIDSQNPTSHYSSVESRLLPGGRQYTRDCQIQPEVLNALEGAPTRHTFLRTPTVTWSGRIYRGTSPRRASRNLPCSKLPAPSCAEE